MHDAYRGLNILITGGLGFIGSNLAIRLVELGANVLIVDSMIPAYGGNPFNVAPVRDRLTINYSDIRDQHSLPFLIRDQDLIFSLAGQVSHLDSMTDPMPDLEINCQSQLALLEACRHHHPGAKIVFASTRQLYGRPQYLPVDENHPLVPVDVNGINKLAAEMYYSLYHQVYGIHTVSLRLTNTYGPRMDLRNDRKGFAGIFLRQAILGETIRLFGTGEQRRDFNYVDDVVEALLIAGQKTELAGNVFNLGNEEHHSLSEFVTTLQQFTDFKSECVPFPPDRERIDIGDYYGSYQKFHEATGWRPQVKLATGLQRSVAFFQEHRQQYLGES